MKFETKVGVSETDKIFVQVYNLVDDLIKDYAKEISNRINKGYSGV